MDSSLSNQASVVFDQVSMRYPDSAHLFRQVSFVIEKGEFVLVTGASGAGKSTLCQLMAGMVTPSSGDITVLQQALKQLNPNALPYLRRRLGVVFQDHKLLFDRTVFDNVVLPLHIQGITGEDAARRVRAALDKVGLRSKEAMYPVTLSGGEQQRLAIARAVVSRPSIIIADEPTAGLDQAAAWSILQLLKAFNDAGVTVIIAMHDLTQVSALAYRTLQIDQQSVTALPVQRAFL